MTSYATSRCVSCKDRYFYQASGWPDPSEKRSSKDHCPSCYELIQNALKDVKPRYIRDWVGVSGVSCADLVQLEKERLDEYKASGKMYLRRTLSAQYDITCPANQHRSGLAHLNGALYQYEYWTLQGGIEGGRVYIEVERDSETGEIRGPWSLTDRWLSPPVFVEHPPWPDPPPRTHEFVPEPMRYPSGGILSMMSNNPLVSWGSYGTRSNMDAVGHKLLKMEQLPEGALPIYGKDPDVTAYVASEDDQGSDE